MASGSIEILTSTGDSSPEVRRRCIWVRHRAFCADGRMECPAQNSSGAHDGYDSASTTHFYLGTIGCEDVASGRVLHGPDIPTVSIYDQLGLRLPGGLDELAEPSKFCLMPGYQGKEAGRAVFLRMVGATLADTSCDTWVFTAVQGLMGSLRWLPLGIEAVCIWPKPDGGPSDEQPMWVVVLRVAEAVPATKLLVPDLYDVMFANGEPRVGGHVRSNEELRRIAECNLERVRQDCREWRAGRLAPPIVKP